MTRWWFVALASCSFEHGKASTSGDALAGDGPVIDARMIDAKPIDARVCPAAPAGCTLFSCASTPSCYYVCGTPKASWSDAAASCASAGLGCLVTIDDQAEQDCIVTVTAPTFQTYVWFGFRQDPAPVEPAGNWDWECGASSYVAPNWGQFEPNNQGGNEHCAGMTNGGAWFDANCGGTARYVCEL